MFFLFRVRLLGVRIRIGVFVNVKKIYLYLSVIYNNDILNMIFKNILILFWVSVFLDVIFEMLLL